MSFDEVTLEKVQANTTQYAYNNPLKYTDPSGHCPMCMSLGQSS